MSPHVSRLRLVFALLLYAAPAAALAQPAVTLEAPLPPLPWAGSMYAVTRVDPDGTIRLTLSEAIPANFRQAVAGSIREGYYLLFASPAEAAAKAVLLSVQVIDVADGPTLTLRTTCEAATRVKAGDGVNLIRPVGSTTAQMRALPGEIPMSGDRPDPAAALQGIYRTGAVINLRLIGVALHNYHSTFNQFPPAVIYGPDGKPWHSWRVLILAYLGQQALYEEYDFTQPWDSTKNRKLLDRMPATYREPAYGAVQGPYTHYAALVGPRTVFPAAGAKQTTAQGTPFTHEGGRSVPDILDGTSNTLSVAPIDPARKIPWTKPEDITVGPDFPGLGKPGGIATPYTLGGKHGAPGVAPVLYADGSVRLITATIKPAVLNALLTVNGGEPVAANAVPLDTDQFRPGLRALKIQIVGNKATATIE